jgi:hypothetical protein
LARSRSSSPGSFERIKYTATACYESEFEEDVKHGRGDDGAVYDGEGSTVKRADVAYTPTAMAAYSAANGPLASDTAADGGRAERHLRHA